jgi:hypothetical protein
MVTQAELARRRRQMRRRIRLVVVQRRVIAVEPAAEDLSGPSPTGPTASRVEVEPATQDRLSGADHGDLDPLVA